MRKTIDKFSRLVRLALFFQIELLLIIFAETSAQDIEGFVDPRAGLRDGKEV